MITCTFFDSGYLDKGMTMINSLLSVSPESIIYVLPMDNICTTVLETEKPNNVVLIDYDDFLQKEQLQSIKDNRTNIEYYYSITPHIIEYVLETFNQEMCTYVDADMFFYVDPDILVNEIGKKDVQIIKHGFSDSIFDKMKEEESGIFCVEFNTFKNTANSFELLKWWKDRCRMYSGYDFGNFGDQKYLNEWVDNPVVSIVKNEGAGIAPWNINQFRFGKKENEVIYIHRNNSKNLFPIVFYHFENIQYITNKKVNINTFSLNLKNDSTLIHCLYYDYLKRIASTKELLKEKYNLNITIKIHPSNDAISKKIIWGNINFLSLIIKIRNRLVKLINHKKDILEI